MDIVPDTLLQLVVQGGIGGIVVVGIYYWNKRAMQKDRLDHEAKMAQSENQKELQKLQGNHMVHMEALVTKANEIGISQVKSTKELTKMVKSCPINAKDVLK